MPTALPIRSRHAAAVQRLSWPNTARFLILLARVRWLNQRLEAGHRRVARYGLNVGGPDLIAAARRWLAVHEAIAVLLGVPELPEAAKVRASLLPIDEVRRRGAAAGSRAPGRSAQD